LIDEINREISERKREEGGKRPPSLIKHTIDVLLPLRAVNLY
jgi:hypothetical protein